MPVRKNLRKVFPGFLLVSKTTTLTYLRGAHNIGYPEEKEPWLTGCKLSQFLSQPRWTEGQSCLSASEMKECYGVPVRKEHRNLWNSSVFRDSCALLKKVQYSFNGWMVIQVVNIMTTLVSTILSLWFSALCTGETFRKIVSTEFISWTLHQFGNSPVRVQKSCKGQQVQTNKRLRELRTDIRLFSHMIWAPVSPSLQNQEY